MKKITMLTESSNRLHVLLSFQKSENSLIFNPIIQAKDIGYQLPKSNRDRNFFISNMLEALMQNALNFTIGQNFEIPLTSEDSFNKSLLNKLCIYNASTYSKFLSELFDSLLEICKMHQNDSSFTDIFSKIYIATLGAFINNLPDQAQNSSFSEYSGNVVQIICNSCEIGSRLTISDFNRLFSDKSSTFNTNDLFCLTELTDFSSNKQNDKLLISSLKEAFDILFEKLPESIKAENKALLTKQNTEKSLALAFKSLYLAVINSLNNSDWNNLALSADSSKLIDFIDYNPKIAIDSSKLKIAFINQTTVFEALASIKSNSKEEFEAAQKSIFSGISNLVPIYSI